MTILDVRDPANPVEAGDYFAGGNTYEVRAVDTLVYLTAGNHGLQILNVANPALPVLVGTWTGHDVRAVAVSGPYAYVGDYRDGLHVIDVSNPAAPVQVAFDSLHHIYDIAVTGSYAYVGALNSLFVFDISNPAQPSLMSSTLIGSYVYGVAVSGTTVFLAAYSNGLVVLDASNPAAPREVGNYATSGQAYAVAALGDNVYVTDHTTGLQAYEFSPSSGIETPAATPVGRAISIQQNPIRDGLIRLGIALPATQPVQLSLFDLTGRRVMQFSLRNLKPGMNRVSLPVPDLATGVYFVTADASFGRHRLKVVITGQ